MAYWTRGNVDARGNVTTFTLGNGVQTARTLTPQNGRLSKIFTTKGATKVQDLNYSFDATCPGEGRDRQPSAQARGQA